MLVFCLFILSILGLLKSVTDFINVWKSEAPLHWQRWEQPEFIDLYRGMFGRLWPIIFGKACDDVQSESLIRKRNDIRFILMIIVLLFIATTAFNEFYFEVKPRWVN